MGEATLDQDDGHTSITAQAEQAVRLYLERFGSRPTSIVLTRVQYERLSRELAERMGAPNPTIFLLASVPVRVARDPG